MRFLTTLLLCAASFQTVRAQGIAISDNGSATPSATAVLDVTSSSKGVLVPRMSTTSRNAISSPATGLMVFDSSLNAFYFYDGSSWKAVGGDNLGDHKATQNINLNGSYLSGDGSASGLLVSAAGNVGIGAASTGPRLSVSQTGTGNAGTFTISNSGSNSNALEATTDGTGYAGAFYGPAYIKGSGMTNGTIALRVENSNSAPLLRVYNNGNLGLNTFNPLGYGGYTAVGTLANKRGMTIASAQSYTADAPAVLELLGSAANVGEAIGMLDFIHQANNFGVYNGARIAAVRESTNPTHTGLAFYTRQSSTFSEQMRITASGNVGIGCSSPNYKLQVTGDIAASGTLRASSAIVSTSITSCSDRRYKRDIHSMVNVLPLLLQIPSVSYHFKTAEFAEKDFPETEQLGFIAQDVESVFPQVVVTMDDGYKAIDYTRFAPLLLQGLREQQQQIETDRLGVEALRKQNEQLRAELQEIRKKLGI
jgi:hypothetical protein